MTPTMSCLTNDGYLGGTSAMFLIGDVSPEAKRIVDVAHTDQRDTGPRLKAGMAIIVEPIPVESLQGVAVAATPPAQAPR